MEKATGIGKKNGYFCGQQNTLGRNTPIEQNKVKNGREYSTTTAQTRRVYQDTNSLTKKNNTIVLKIFNEEEINDMKTKVKLMIGKGKCPIKEPITSPNPNTSISKSKSVESTLQDQLRSPSNETNIETLIYTDPQLVRTRPAPPEPPDSPSSSSSSNPEEHSSPERARRSLQFDQTPPRPPNDRQYDTDPEQQELEEELANKIEETKGLNMEDRPKLIKLQETKTLRKLLKKVNKGLTR